MVAIASDQKKTKLYCLVGKDSFVGIELRERFKCKMGASAKCESLAYHE